MLNENGSVRAHSERFTGFASESFQFKLLLKKYNRHSDRISNQCNHYALVSFGSLTPVFIIPFASATRFTEATLFIPVFKVYFA